MSNTEHKFKLTIQLTQHDRDLEVRAEASGGQARAETQAPSNSLLDQIEDSDPANIPISTIESIGKALYKNLMVGDVDRLAAALFQEATQMNQHVLLELRFDHDQVRLTQFPWEMVVNDLGQFLVRDGLVDITRYITYPQIPPRFDTVVRDIPLLRIVASPPSLPPITTQNLALDNIQTLAHATFDQFTHMLLIERIPLWGLQFDGHGALVLRCPECSTVNPLEEKNCRRCGALLETAQQVGALAFERNGDVDWVKTEEFGSILYNAQVKLAMLLACESARTGGRIAFNGLAPGLLLAGVPAVVGMQYPVLDDFANNFANSFYAVLMRSHDILDALRTARRMNVRGAWYSPVMYLRYQEVRDETVTGPTYHVRIVDTALPSKVKAGDDFLARLWIRRPETKALSEEQLREELDVPEAVPISQRQTDANLKFEPVEQATGRKLRRGEVEVSLESPAECEIRPSRIKLFVDENLDAPPAIFCVRIKTKGKVPLIFRLSQDGGIIASVTHRVEALNRLRTRIAHVETESHVVGVQSEQITAPAVSHHRRGPEKITVLIVDDTENTREGTARLLEYEDNIDIVGFAENGAVAVERVRELQPHVVLMDINMPVMNGIDATAQISKIAPRTKVIMVSVQDDSQYLKQAFRAGAVDFAAKPITSADLAQAIERAYNSIQAEPAAARQQPMPMTSDSGGWMVGAAPAREGYIIGVIGYKGGMGKTTVAVNLALGLARARKKTVLVDGNLLFGDVSVFLNSRGQHTIIDIARMATEPDQFDPDMLTTVLVSHDSGLKLLIAPANPSESEPISAAAMVNLFAFLKREFEYVVVDTSSSTGFDEVLAAVIQSADRLVLLTTPTMPALKDARILLAELSSFEGVLERVNVVLNQIDKTSRITPDQISNFLKQPVAIQIPVDLSAVEAVNQGIGLITLDPRNVPSVKPLMELVQLIRESCEVDGAQTTDKREISRRGGLFGLGE